MLNYILGCFTTYSTTRQVQIKSIFLAALYWIIVITVWVCYLGSLGLDLRNVYQKPCQAQGSIVTKVKGQISTEDIPDSEFKVPNPALYKRVWDFSDLIFPPYGGDGQDGSFIAATNIIITSNQTRGLCPEIKKERMSKCNMSSEDRDCKKGATSPSSNGILTGKCVNETNTCEISGWCPAEKSSLPLKGFRALLEGVQDFTVMLKNSVEFPECGNKLQKRNIPENATKDYLSSCIYDKENNNLCPIFRLGDVVKWSGNNFSEVALTGGVFRISSKWDCDFDWSTTQCYPSYEFERIDDKNAKLSAGWNFRVSYYHEENRRTLSKVYGLKILVVTTGHGKQFNFLQLCLALGSTIGLFSVAPLFCDTLFELLCYLKRFTPFNRCFGDFSIKSRTEVDGTENKGNKLELTSTSTADNGTYKGQAE